MFLAWNELKQNKLKFSLIIGILVLISYLLFLLSGLANGLINMNVEGINKWNADAIILNENANKTVAQSVFDTEIVNTEAFDAQNTLKQTGVIISNGSIDENALLFGVSDDAFIIPSLIEGERADQLNEVIADQTLRQKGFKLGDTLTLSRSDETLTIVGFSEPARYGVAPVLFGSDDTFRTVQPMMQEGQTNAMVVRDADWQSVPLDDSLDILSIDEFVEYLPGYRAQNMTLNFMITFLFIISATVIAVFCT